MLGLGQGYGAPLLYFRCKLNVAAKASRAEPSRALSLSASRKASFGLFENDGIPACKKAAFRCPSRAEQAALCVFAAGKQRWYSLLVSPPVVVQDFRN